MYNVNVIMLAWLNKERIKEKSEDGGRAGISCKSSRIWSRKLDVKLYSDTRTSSCYSR